MLLPPLLWQGWGRMRLTSMPPPRASHPALPLPAPPARPLCPHLAWPQRAAPRGPPAVPRVLKGGGARHAAAVRPLLIQRHPAGDGDACPIGVSSRPPPFSPTSPHKRRHPPFHLTTPYPTLPPSCPPSPPPAPVRLLIVAPQIGAVVANDAASYRYLVESIRMFPDQETWAGVSRALLLLLLLWMLLATAVAAAGAVGLWLWRVPALHGAPL